MEKKKQPEAVAMEQPEEKVKVQLITHEQYLSLKLDTILESLTELNNKVDELTKLAKE